MESCRLEFVPRNTSYLQGRYAMEIAEHCRVLVVKSYSDQGA